jgi:hypothetical protein
MPCFHMANRFLSGYITSGGLISFHREIETRGLSIPLASHRSPLPFDPTMSR